MMAERRALALIGLVALLACGHAIHLPGLTPISYPRRSPGGYKGQLPDVHQQRDAHAMVFDAVVRTEQRGSEKVPEIAKPRGKPVGRPD